MKPGGGGSQHGIPNAPLERRKIAEGLNDDEKQQFEELLRRIDAGKELSKPHKKFIRRLIGRKKIIRPSKRFRGRDRKTHQEP